MSGNGIVSRVTPVHTAGVRPQGRLPEAECASTARTLRPDLPRSAEGAIAGSPRRHITIGSSAGSPVPANLLQFLLRYVALGAPVV
jgi:hypothetical protein